MILALLLLLVTTAGGLLIASGLFRGSMWAGHSSDSSRLRRRLVESGEVLVASWGWALSALLVVVAGAGLTWVIVYPVGELMERLEALVDLPVFLAVEAGSEPGSSAAAEILTQIGNRAEVKTVIVVAAVVLALQPYFRRIGWWLPGLALVTSFFTLKVVQETLAAYVDRGTPPVPQGGTFPSGGVARLVVVWGLIAVLLLMAHPTMKRWLRTGIWAVVGLAVGLESFARIYLSQHWTLDVVASWLLGPMILVTISGAVLLVASARSRAEPALPPR